MSLFWQPWDSPFEKKAAAFIAKTTDSYVLTKIVAGGKKPAARKLALAKLDESSREHAFFMARVPEVQKEILAAIKDKNLLVDLITKCGNSAVCRQALKDLPDDADFKKIVLHGGAVDEELRCQALERMRSGFNDVLLQGPYLAPEILAQCIAKTASQNTLLAVAQSEQYRLETRMLALEHLTDDRKLFALATTARYEQLHEAAVARLNNDSLLRKIAALDHTTAGQAAAHKLGPEKLNAVLEPLLCEYPKRLPDLEFEEKLLAARNSEIASRLIDSLDARGVLRNRTLLARRQLDNRLWLVVANALLKLEDDEWAAIFDKSVLNRLTADLSKPQHVDFLRTLYRRGWVQKELQALEGRRISHFDRECTGIGHFDDSVYFALE